MSETTTSPDPKTSEMETPSSTKKAKGRCPECGKEIDFLVAYATAEYYHDGQFEYNEIVLGGWDDDVFFICPECEEEIAWSIEEADEILGLKERRAAEGQREADEKRSAKEISDQAARNGR